MKQDSGLIGCLLALLIMLLVPCIYFAVGYFLTWLIIWVSNGLFNYDLSDKFWYVFVIIFFIIPILRGSCNVNINGGK